MYFYSKLHSIGGSEESFCKTAKECSPPFCSHNTNVVNFSKKLKCICLNKTLQLKLIKTTEHLMCNLLLHSKAVFLNTASEHAEIVKSVYDFRSGHFLRQKQILVIF